MAFINGRKIVTCIYGGKVIPLVLKLASVGGVIEVSLATLADVGMHSLSELNGKTLRDFK